MKKLDEAIFKGVIVGAGHFADIQLEAWQAVRGATIEAIMSLENAEALAKKYNLRVFTDFDTMIKEVKPDFVDVCTPPDSHFHYTKLSVDASIPVLCQKPVASTYEESEQLVKYAMSRDVPLMINENWRWQAWYREIKRMIELGMLGKVYHAYAAMRPGDGWGENPYPLQPYFKDMKQFLIYETGIHYIDTFRYLFGEIDSVYCQTRTINPIIAGEDLAVINFNFSSGMTGIYDANRTTYMEEIRCLTYGWMTLEGTEGKLRLEQNGKIMYTPRNETMKEHEYFIPQNGWKGGCTVATQQHFVDCLRTGDLFETNGTEYLKSVRVVYACYESAKRDQVVELR